jgi:hypothetical protein
MAGAFKLSALSNALFTIEWNKNQRYQRVYSKVTLHSQSSHINAVILHKNSMKPFSNQRSLISPPHWKLKWGWRKHRNTAHFKPKDELFELNELRNTPFPDVITF